MSRTTSARRALVAAWLAAGTLLLGSGAAWAAPEGRVQEVVSEPGTVRFVLSADGLAAGQAIDPGTVRVQIGGLPATTTAVPIEESIAAPERTVMLALDASGSMGEDRRLAKAKLAANQYLDTLPAQVRAGLVSFADRATVVVAPTTDRAEVRQAVAQLEAEGATALNDAVVLAARELGDSGSRNIVLLSDGQDEGSRTSAKRARRDLAASGAVLDAVALGSGGQEQELAAFAAAGNGSLVTATDAESLTAAFESAARTVSGQLAVTAAVPQVVGAGTSELQVTARVGDQGISDTLAVLITPAVAADDAKAFGPVTVPALTPSLLDEDWVRWTLIGLVFLGLGTVAVLAFGALDAKNRKEGRIQRRLGDVTMPGGAPRPAEAAPTSALGDGPMTRAVLSLADRVAESRDTSALARRLEEAHVALRPAEWVVVHGLIVVLSGLAATLLGGFRPLVTLGAVLLGATVPWLVLGIRASRRRSEFYAALPDALQMMAGSLSAGYSLPQALDGVARETGGAFGQEMNRALLESRLGLPIEEALEAAAQRMHSSDFHWVVMAIRTNRQVGGNLAEVLTNVGRTLRERERLRRQIRTLSAEGKLSGWIIGALPLGMLAFLVVFRPEFMAPMFTTLVGWIMLALGAIAYVLGILWIRNLVNMEV